MARVNEILDAAVSDALPPIVRADADVGRRSAAEPRAATIAVVTGLRRSVEGLPWAGVVLVCATLGLAPFNPPHVVEKLGMLARGELSRPIDIFDLVLHGLPWVLLIARAALALKPRTGA